MSNRKFLAFLLTSAALALSAPEAWAAGSAKSGMAPMSPEFLKWREEQAKIRAAGGVTKTARNYGVRPSPLNLAHLSGNPVRVAAELPEKFDLRSWDVVPPLRNQLTWGTCWAFATVAAMETNYLLQINGRSTDGYITSAIDGIGTTSMDVDLSEMHLAWFSFMGPKMAQRFTNTKAKDTINPTSNETLNAGAFPLVPMAVLSHGKDWGPVNELDLPYIGASISFEAVAQELGVDPYNITQEQIAEVEQEMEKRSNTYCNTHLGGKRPNDYKSVLRLKEAAYAASLYMLDDNDGGNGNTRPSNPGAWLIRNSWGEDDGKGYFWMSYEQDIGYGTAFSMTPADSLTPYTTPAITLCLFPTSRSQQGSTSLSSRKQ